MGTNCFVRTLKEEIANDNLPRIDTLHINIKKAGDYYFTLPGISSIELVGNGTLLQDGTPQGKLIEDYDGTQFQVHALEPLKLLIIGVSGGNGTFRLYDQNHTPSNKYVVFNLEEALQNTEQYNSFRIGSLSSATMGWGCGCTGDVTNMVFNAAELYMGGCDKLRGSLDNVVRDQATQENLVTIAFTGTKVAFNLSSLARKYYLYIKPSNAATSGDVKYFGDTRNRYIEISKIGSNNMTGSIDGSNGLIARLIARNRTGESDSVYFVVGYENSGDRFKNVTYLGKGLNQYYNEYVDEHPTPNWVYMVFTWDSEGNISYNMTTVDPNTPSIPLTSVPVP